MVGCDNSLEGDFYAVFVLQHSGQHSGGKSPYPHVGWGDSG